MPAEIQAKGLAPDEPASRTVEVDAFCSWSAWENDDAAHGAGEPVDLVLLARDGKTHVQEVRRIVELVAGMKMKGWPIEYL